MLLVVANKCVVRMPKKSSQKSWLLNLSCPAMVNVWYKGRWYFHQKGDNKLSIIYLKNLWPESSIGLVFLRTASQLLHWVVTSFSVHFGFWWDRKGVCYLGIILLVTKRHAWMISTHTNTGLLVSLKFRFCSTTSKYCPILLLFIHSETQNKFKIFQNLKKRDR